MKRELAKPIVPGDHVREIRPPYRTGVVVEISNGDIGMTGRPVDYLVVDCRTVTVASGVRNWERVK